MIRTKFPMVAPLILALIGAFGWLLQMQAQDSSKDNKTPYPSMAPLEQYLMPRDAEIALARSAAPESISRDATVMVFGRRSYETAVEGKNGFVCVVERAWTSPFDSPEYSNPKNRSPICYNPPAARTILPITYMRTKLVLEGLSKEQIRERAKAAVDRKEIAPVEPGAMCFMMGEGAYLTDNGLTADGAHNMAHLMFFTPLIDPAEWGANMDKSPVVIDSRRKGDPEPINVYMVLTGAWSDGTPAPVNWTHNDECEHHDHRRLMKRSLSFATRYSRPPRLGVSLRRLRHEPISEFIVPVGKWSDGTAAPTD